MIDFFETHLRPNILILGNLGSGKTSLVYYILSSHRDKSVIFSQNPNGKLNISNGIGKRHLSVTTKPTNQLLDIIEQSETVVFENIETIPKNQAWLIKRCLDDREKRVILTSTTAWQQPYEEKFFHDISREKKMNIIDYLIVGKIAVNIICSSIFQNYQDIYSGFQAHWGHQILIMVTIHTLKSLPVPYLDENRCI